MSANPATLREAVTAAGRILAAARQERDEQAARGGPEAVAEAAHIPGGPSKAEIATAYEVLQQHLPVQERARCGTCGYLLPCCDCTTAA